MKNLSGDFVSRELLGNTEVIVHGLRLREEQGIIVVIPVRLIKDDRILMKNRVRAKRDDRVIQPRIRAAYNFGTYKMKIAHESFARGIRYRRAIEVESRLISVAEITLLNFRRIRSLANSDIE